MLPAQNPIPPIHDQSRQYATTPSDFVFTLVAIPVSQIFIIVNATVFLDSITENLFGLFRCWVLFTTITVMIFLWGIRSAYKDGSQVSTYRTILAVVVLEVEPLAAWTFWGDQYLQMFRDSGDPLWRVAPYLVLLMLVGQGYALHALDMAYCSMTSDAMINRDGPLGGQETFAGFLYGAITGQASRQR